MKQSIVHSFIISLIATVTVLFSLQLSFAQVRSSSNYQLQSDSINIGGGLSTSTSYQQESTAGELATGRSVSANYQLRAGYQQMQEVFISLTPSKDVIMDTAIGGITGGVSNGSTTVTVTTDSPAGYSLTIEAENSPAMQQGFESILDHTLSTTRVFDTTGGQARFGYSVFGLDATNNFRNNGSVCGSGANVVQECWRGMQTAAYEIATGADANHPSGEATTVYFRVVVPSGAGVISGEYIATTTLTAIPL
jgi:hypothetical protein